jgi:hypothetical protein
MELAEKHFSNAKVYMEVFGDLRDEQIVATIKKAKEGLLVGEYDTSYLEYMKKGYKGNQPARMQRLFNSK